MNGKVLLVGAGPGDAGLFTIKGRRALENADVVVYDALVGQGVLALIPPQVRKINVGKRASHHLMPQGDINKLLLNEAKSGNRVVRLKGGDPFLFGRGGEELELLRENGIAYEVIPGVTSALSVPAYAGIPVTHRGLASSLHIITGHTKTQPQAEVNYNALAKLGGTLVFLMGITALEAIMNGLLEGGILPAMPAAVLERGTTAHQRRVVSTVEHLANDAKAANIKTPAIIVVGEVCLLADKFHWAEDRPLGNICVAVTRPYESASSLTLRLQELGAEVIELPTIKIEPIKQNAPLESALQNISAYTWLAFTSPAGVRVFYDQLLKMHKDIRSLAGVKIAAVGAATAKALEHHGLLVDCVPQTYSGVHLGEELGAKAQGGRVLVLRAAQGSKKLVQALAEAGVNYDDIALYNTDFTTECDEALRAQIACGDIDYALFTSASTVKGFSAVAGGASLSHIRAICIGQETAAEARLHGMNITVPQEASIESMVAELIKLNKEKTSGGKIYGAFK